MLCATLHSWSAKVKRTMEPFLLGLPAREPLSNRVIHIRFVAASVGSSIMDLPISKALLLRTLMKKASSLLEWSVRMTCGRTKVYMYPMPEATLISMRAAELN